MFSGILIKALDVSPSWRISGSVLGLSSVRCAVRERHNREEAANDDQLYSDIQYPKAKQVVSS